MKFLFLALTSFFLSLHASAQVPLEQEEELDLLFICCDIGETRALLPVMRSLSGQTALKVMAMGASVGELQGDDKLKERLIFLSEPVNTAIDRTKPLADVAAQIKGLYAKVLVSGAASKAQEQLLSALPAQRKIVYLDSFHYSPASPAFPTAMAVAREADEIICVSEGVKREVAPYLPCHSLWPLGRPSLETWVEQVEAIDRAAVWEKLNLATGELVLFIGGYGPRYEKVVNGEFAQAITTLQAAGYHAYLQPHPNVAKKPLLLTTAEAVAAADFIVCYDSTVGYEALFAGKKAIYFQPYGLDPYDNGTKGLAPCVRSTEELIRVISTFKFEKGNVYETLGLPKGSKKIIEKHIMSLIKNHFLIDLN